MKQIKTRHKLIPAIIMLLVAAITMSTASYAWFTMSTKVEVTGIELKVVAPANILIREGTAGVFGTIATVTTNPTTGKLNHASSADGVSFFTIDQTTAAKVLGDGGIPADPTIIAANQAATDTETGYYYDYTFQLINTGGDAVNVGVRNVAIAGKTESTADQGIAGAVRFAILNKAKTANIHASKPLFAKGSDSANALTSNSTPPYHDGAVAANKEFTSTLFQLAAAGTTAPTNETELTVRVWIEGQDGDCKTANSNSSFTIEFEFYMIP